MGQILTLLRWLRMNSSQKSPALLQSHCESESTLDFSSFTIFSFLREGSQRINSPGCDPVMRDATISARQKMSSIPSNKFMTSSNCRSQQHQIRCRTSPLETKHNPKLQNCKQTTLTRTLLQIFNQRIAVTKTAVNTHYFSSRWHRENLENLFWSLRENECSHTNANPGKNKWPLGTWTVINDHGLR